jgi:hypothetical protein
LLEESSATIGANHRLAPPIWFRPIAELRVQPRLRPRVLGFISGTLVTIDQREEPVPMEEGNVVVQVGRRVPAQEVIVIKADLIRCVVVADVVVVGLWQRNVHDTENQHADSQESPTAPQTPPLR